MSRSSHDAPLLSRRRLLAGGAMLAMVGGSAAAASRIGNHDDYRGTPLLGHLAPTEPLTTVDGKSVSLTDFAGRSVIVNFWNTWCAPCREEVPALETFWSRHSNDSDVALVGIVRDDTSDAVRDWVNKRRWDWTIALDPDSRTALAFGTLGQPETFAITADRLVVGRRIGAASIDDLEQLLAMARGQA